MIRHVAVFKFKDNFGPDEREKWMGMIKELPDHIPQIKYLSIGSDIVGGDNSYDVGLIVDFESLEDLEIYSTHPKHQPVLDVSGPVKEHLAVVDFQLN